MFNTLPTAALTVLDWQWPDYAPFAADLLQRQITPSTLATFMEDWTRFSDLVTEASSRMYVATTLDTADEAAEKRYLNFYQTIYPELARLNNTLNQRLVDSGLHPADYEIPLRAMRSRIALFREENLPIISQLTELTSQYDKIRGAQTIQWDGAETTLEQMKPVFMQPDRARREQAFWRIHERQMQDKPALNALWAQMFTLRQQMARNAGFANFLEYTWQDFGRFDYTLAQVQEFHQAIADVVVPAVRRLNVRLQARLGVETLRQWDVSAEVPGREPLKPFQSGAELEAVTATIFNGVDPELGRYFQTMRDEKLLDLENYKGKAPGGYCTDYPVIQRPFIFMNAVGVHDDVQTMLHEAGHAFHAFESAAQPYLGMRHAPIEFCEVASMSMELLAAPGLARSQGGFYSEAEAARARIEHLEGMLVFWPYMAVVDSFQQWAYTSGEAALDAAACDAQWTALWHRFKQGVDYTGLESWVANGWQRKLHIYTVPLYYVEYGIALLGAAQVWDNSLRDPAQALAAYRRGLRLGNTAALPALFEAAGARLAFDAATLGRMVALIEETIESLEAVAGS
ncbi:MAG: M3 family oligoendopeptidase [Anaerolineae bacterium]|nr:M3 family oligoendopeptidase [Anaerolineae bacterium]